MTAHFDDERRIEILRGSVAALACLVAGQAALGFLGLWDQGTASAWLLALVVTAVFFVAIRAGFLSMRRPLFSNRSSWEAGLALALAVAFASRCGSAVGGELFFYDAISYHLHFASSWMHTGQLEIVPTVFGDLAPAYGASNVELVSHALMTVLHSAYLAQAAQLPFLWIGLLALISTVRELGGTRAGALAAALAFLMIWEVWLQSAIAMVDVALASLFVAMLPFLIRLWRSPSRRDLVSLALALGLFVGTKSLALLFGLPLLIAGAWILWRQRDCLPGAASLVGWAGFCLSLVIATGGFWYLRNWIVTGNPIFPVEVQLGPLVLFDGIYTPATMREWEWHYSVWSLNDFARLLLSAGIGFVFAGMLALGLRRRQFDWALAAVLLSIAWFVVPYQHSRFFMPFYAVLAISLGALSARTETRRLGAILLAVAIGSSVLAWPDWTRFSVVAAFAIGWFLPRFERVLPLRPIACLLVIALLVAMTANFFTYRTRYPEYGVSDDLDAAWTWVHENVEGAHFAYAGSNLPFPLTGRDLRNRVSYANVSLGVDARAHDFPASENAKTAEPVIYRQGARYDAWLQNLRKLGVDRLFVSTLFPIVATNMESDPEGFPVERSWADSHPETFQPIYQNESVMLYRVRPTDSIGDSSPSALGTPAETTPTR